MPVRKELEDWLDEYLEVDRISDYLPNGLQIEGRDTIKKIVTAVSINLEVVEAAIKHRADAIVVHHGMFWKSDKPAISGYRKLRIKKIIDNDISLFAYHLPLDLHPEISHNRLILKGLGVDEIDGHGNNGNIKKDYSIGLTGIFERPLLFDQLIKRVNKILKTQARYFKYGKKSIQSLYVVSGAGKNMIDQISHLGVDAYLTGDVQESTEHIAKEESLNYIFAGHYNTERPGMIELGEKIGQRFQVDVLFVDINNPL